MPATVVCPEFTSEMLREWVGQGLAPVLELSKIRDVDYVDVPTGRWPQFSRPTTGAVRIIGATITLGRHQADPGVQGQ